MPFESVRFDRVVLVRWVGVPTMADTRELSDLLGRASSAVGQLLLYVAIVPAALDGVPPADVRSAMVTGLRDALTKCESIDMIMLSEGLAGSMLRTIVRSMGLMSGMGHKFFIHESSIKAITRLRTRIQDENVLKRLQGELDASSTPVTQLVR